MKEQRSPVSDNPREIIADVPISLRGFDVAAFAIRAYGIEQRRFNAVERAELRAQSEFEEMDGEGIA